MKPIVLVACCGQKRDFACPAKDLYVSDLFVKSRAYAERFGSAWAILSAKHGIVDPDAIIEPYDETLADMGKLRRLDWDWKVGHAFNALYGRGAPVTVLAGEHYRGWCSFRDNIDIPMKGMGIGQQKAWLKAVLADTTIERRAAA